MSTLIDLLTTLIELIRRLFEGPSPSTPAPIIPPAPQPTPQPTPQAALQAETPPEDPAVAAQEPVGRPAPIIRRVMLVIYDPLVPSLGNARLSKTMAWRDPDDLLVGYISDLAECSYGMAQYVIAERHLVNAFPPKQDGTITNIDDFIQCWRAGKPCHQPDTADYSTMLSQWDLTQKVNDSSIDEVWLFGPPYAGFTESVMVGPGGFYCNAQPIVGDPTLKRRFVVMGFSYERAVGEMLESFGHRAEFTLKQVFRTAAGDANLFERFERYDLTTPGKAEVGSIHFAPNSLQDYQWGSQTQVPSRCDTWYHFPDLSGDARMVNCDEWGGGDIRAHHRWWLLHLPHVSGSQAGITRNWWQYVLDPNLVK